MPFGTVLRLDKIAWADMSRNDALSIALYCTILHCASSVMPILLCTATVQIFVFPATTAPFLTWACAVGCH